MVKTLGIISLGCPKNTVDSERILGELAKRGWTLSDDINTVDCMVVNTCGFISDAVLESVEALNEICELKNDRPDVVLVATGCLPQRDGSDIAGNFPEIDLIVGVGNLDQLPDLIEKTWYEKTQSTRKQVNVNTPGRAVLSYSDMPRLRLTPWWTAYLKIAEGCDHSCSFCTIPSIKGPHISRPVEDIVAEALKLESEGVREIIIISQDPTAYGSDIGTNLRTLLTELDNSLGDGVKWVRLHYLYPSKVSDSLLDLIANSKHIIPYFDIPLQHVRPGILKGMKRLAPDIDALELIDRVRKKFENSPTPACVRTTILVGFPGETEDDIQAVYDFIEEARIDRLTAFIFSPEDGTPAAELPDQVPGEIAEQRLLDLMEIQTGISFDINESWLGREMDVLIEGETDDGRMVGRSYRDAPEIDGLVIISGVPENVELGAFVRVAITGALEYDLEGDFTLQLE